MIDWIAVADIITAATVAATFVNSVINSRRVKKVREDMQVPNGTRGGNALGGEVHEIRKDLYELGVLFGSHLVHHEETEGSEFPVRLSDLSDKAQGLVRESNRREGQRQQGHSPDRPGT